MSVLFFVCNKMKEMNNNMYAHDTSVKSEAIR